MQHDTWSFKIILYKVKLMTWYNQTFHHVIHYKIYRKLAYIQVNNTHRKKHVYKQSKSILVKGQCYLRLFSVVANLSLWTNVSVNPLSLFYTCYVQFSLLQGLLNFEIVGLKCRVIATEYISRVHYKHT